MCIRAVVVKDPLCLIKHPQIPLKMLCANFCYHDISRRYPLTQFTQNISNFDQFSTNNTFFRINGFSFERRSLSIFDNIGLRCRYVFCLLISFNFTMTRIRRLQYRCHFFLPQKLKVVIQHLQNIMKVDARLTGNFFIQTLVLIMYSGRKLVFQGNLIKSSVQTY